MVKYRGSSLMRTSLTTKLLSRKKSPKKIALYIVVLLAFSILVFVFKTQSILEEVLLVSQTQGSEPQHMLVSVGKLWDAPFSNGLHPCVEHTAKYKVMPSAKGPNRFLTVRSNGGLNQMRTGISDMVAVAHIMNATLVIPQMDKRSFWQDSSTFSDIFDELHFIKTLQGDVRIVKELPKELEAIPRLRKHFTSWSGMGYYKEMTQLWKDYQVIHVPKSDSRLVNNDLPLDIQRLRCHAMYHALRFSAPIESLGKNLVERLRSLGGRYIALHLRYEKDMLAFTGCTYGLTDSESEELRIMRENTNHWKVKQINSTEQRMGGLCPLTPKEVAIFLQALGYPPSTLIYIAAGDIYGGDTRLSVLMSHFPNLVLKEKLATEEELKPFANHASKTAALDYIISLESDVFIPSYSGNMARAVEGHRRFLGHRKTINPDRKGLVQLFDDLESGQQSEGPLFSYLVQQMHNNREHQKEENVLQELKGKHVLELKNHFMKTHTQSVCAIRRQYKIDIKNSTSPCNLLEELLERRNILVFGNGCIFRKAKVPDLKISKLLNNTSHFFLARCYTYPILIFVTRNVIFPAPVK